MAEKKQETPVKKVEEKKEEAIDVKEEKAESKKEEKPKKKEEKSNFSKKKKSYEAVINIYTSFNNTIVHVTDMSGRTISKVTGGMTTKHNRLKANPTIGMFIAKRIGEELREKHINSLYVKIRAKTGNPAPGPGANAIIKSLTKDGFKIISIMDMTRVPRGGPKRKGGRRGRRP